MDSTKTVDLDDKAILEFQDSTTPLTRFEEYVRYSQQLEKSDINSTEGD